MELRNIDTSSRSSRRLGGIESAMAIGNECSPFNLVTVLHLRVAPRSDLLRRVLNELQRRHPPLRSRIERERRGFRFVYDDTPVIPLDVVEATDGSSWIDEVERRLNEQFPAQGPLAAVTVVRREVDRSAHLVVAFQHAIVDGVAAATLLGDILTDYAALADETHDGGVVPEAVIPPPADDLIPERYRGRNLLIGKVRYVLRGIVDESRFRWSTRSRAPRVDRGGRTQVHTHTFDEETTARLDEAARSQQCTVHSLLHGTVLSVVHDLRYGAVPTRLRTVAFADLRAHLEPRVPGHFLAPYVALTSQDVSIEPGRELWDLSRQVHAEVRASVDGGARFVNYSMNRPLMRMATATARFRMATTAVSHTGPVDIAGADGPLEADDLHAFVSNLTVGPEVSMRTGMFRGRLTLDMMTLDTDMTRDDMADLATAIADRLLQAAETT